MMWNWLVTSLAVGVTIVLYDGSPIVPTPHVLFDLVDKQKYILTTFLFVKNAEKLSNYNYEVCNQHKITLTYNILG